jgi:hypothetical protein
LEAVTTLVAVFCCSCFLLLLIEKNPSWLLFQNFEAATKEVGLKVELVELSLY